MTASQIINEIQKLSHSEIEKVAEFLRYIPNEETIKAMEEPVENLPRFRNVDELLKDLDS